MTSVEQARQGVEKSFKEALQWAESDEKHLFWVFEGRLWSLLLAVGRALVALFLVRRVFQPRAATYIHDERKYEIKGMRTTMLGTLFGKVSFSRPVGRLVGWRRKTVDLPVDRELGLHGGFSLGVVLEMGRLCAQMAFKWARDSFPAGSPMGPEPADAASDRGWAGRPSASVS
jgi:hypothetical protein